jgi:hypothetical protein
VRGPAAGQAGAPTAADTDVGFPTAPVDPVTNAAAAASDAKGFRVKGGSHGLLLLMMMLLLASVLELRRPPCLLAASSCRRCSKERRSCLRHLGVLELQQLQVAGKVGPSLALLHPPARGVRRGRGDGRGRGPRGAYSGHKWRPGATLLLSLKRPSGGHRLPEVGRGVQRRRGVEQRAAARRQCLAEEGRDDQA